MTHSGNDFEAATLPFLDNLYRIAFRMVHDQAAAEHSIERTYTEARKSFHHLTEVTDYRMWLFSILFRELHNRRRAWLHIKDWWNGSRADHPAREADQDVMLRALDDIPGILREVVLLADVEGFGKREIQKILYMPEDVVASRLAEGRARLRAAVAHGGPVDPPFLEDRALA